MFNFIRLLNKKTDTKLLLLGRFMNNAEGKKWVEKINADQSLTDSIEIIGEVTEKEKLELYQEAFAFILPRRNHKDEIASFPTRLIEYLIEGKLVIASPIGDIPYYLSEDDLIYLKSDNLLETVEKTVMAIEDQNAYFLKCNKGFAKAKQSFNSKKHMNQILKMIDA